MYCHIGTKGTFSGLQNTRKSVFGGGSAPRMPLEELTTLPQTLVGWRGTSLLILHRSTPLGTDPPSALAMRPQNSSQIYAYGFLAPTTFRAEYRLPLIFRPTP